MTMQQLKESPENGCAVKMKRQGPTVGRKKGIGTFNDYDDLDFFQPGHSYRVESLGKTYVIRLKGLEPNFPYCWTFQGASYDRIGNSVSVQADAAHDREMRLPYGDGVVAVEIGAREANKIIKACASRFNAIKEIIR